MSQFYVAHSPRGRYFCNSYVGSFDPIQAINYALGNHGYPGFEYRRKMSRATGTWVTYFAELSQNVFKEVPAVSLYLGDPKEFRQYEATEVYTPAPEPEGLTLTPLWNINPADYTWQGESEVYSRTTGGWEKPETINEGKNPMQFILSKAETVTYADYLPFKAHHDF